MKHKMTVASLYSIMADHDVDAERKGRAIWNIRKQNYWCYEVKYMDGPDEIVAGNAIVSAKKL